MLNNESFPSKHSYKSLEFTDAKFLQEIRCVTEVSVGIESVNLVLYTVLNNNSTHQHSSSKVKLVVELSDEDVDTDEIILIFLLHFTNDVSQPLEMFLSTSHPDEVNLERK